MTLSVPLGVATGTWAGIAVALVLCLLVAGPVLAVCVYALLRRSPDADELAVADVARFVELRERARSELAATRSLERFIELKEEARGHLWPTAAERARRPRGAAEPAHAPPVAAPTSPPVGSPRAHVRAVRRRWKGEGMRVLVAGAAGAIGQRLVPQLVASGHQVVATTRSREKLELLRGLGAEAVLMDGLDRLEVGEAIARTEPDAIVHQMTALASMSDLRHFDRGFAVTNELRTKGTDHLLAAAEAAGVHRFVAQSYTGWPNIREGGPVKTEDDLLDPHPPAQQSQTLAAIRSLERAVLEARLEGVVLRYGSFYGPGASEQLLELVRRRKLPIVGSGSGVWSWIHVDDAAAATVAALERGAAGVYNIVDDQPVAVAEWLPYLAEVVGAKPPRHVPVWLGRFAAGEVAVSMMTQIRGSSNAKARRALSWRPRWASWRDGFRYGLTDPARRSPARGAA
jgi:nucleoside-diphosphate-sugar epimerase